MSILARSPMSFTMEDGILSQSVTVVFEQGGKTLSLHLDNSCGRMSDLRRGDIRLFVGSVDVTRDVFSEAERPCDLVHASLDNFEKAQRWLRRTG